MKPIDTANGRALSPVIGVVLMVAITVLLAATTASFFLDFGQSNTKSGAPTVTFESSYDSKAASETLDLRITGGESLQPDSVQVVISDAACGGTTWSHRFTPTALGVSASKLMAGTTLPLSEATVCGRPATASGPLDLSGAHVEVIWVGPDGSRSQRLYQWDGPDA